LEINLPVVARQSNRTKVLGEVYTIEQKLVTRGIIDHLLFKK